MLSSESICEVSNEEEFGELSYAELVDGVVVGVSKMGASCTTIVTSKVSDSLKSETVIRMLYVPA